MVEVARPVGCLGYVTAELVYRTARPRCIRLAWYLGWVVVVVSLWPLVVRCLMLLVQS